MVLFVSLARILGGDPEPCCLYICLLVVFCTFFVCFCFVQWLRRRITDEDPAFCCVWCLGSKRSLFLFSSFFWSFTSNTVCWYVVVMRAWGYPPSSPFVDVAPKVSQYSSLNFVFLSTSVFYFCFLIYSSSISTDMGNKWELSQPTCLHDFYGSVCIPAGT